MLKTIKSDDFGVKVNGISRAVSVRTIQDSNYNSSGILTNCYFTYYMMHDGNTERWVTYSIDDAMHAHDVGVVKAKARYVASRIEDCSEGSKPRRRLRVRKWK